MLSVRLEVVDLFRFLCLAVNLRKAATGCHLSLPTLPVLVLSPLCSCVFVYLFRLHFYEAITYLAGSRLSLFACFQW
jgi:NhaP-type Na+/H+ and K+/H+ antiporter